MKNTNTNTNTNDIVIFFSISLILIAYAFLLTPVRTGDGQFYFGMLVGLVSDASPAISDHVVDVVIARTKVNPLDHLTSGVAGGKIYAWHFWAYSLLCVPAYILLDLLGLDTLKAFQITNALLISFGLAYLLFFSRFTARIRYFISAVFLLSTGTLYFQWTHPEIYSTVFTLVACCELIKRKYVSSTFFAAIASFQNPSISFLIFPLLCIQLYELYSNTVQGKLKIILLRMLPTAFTALIVLLPYIWNFYAFGVYNPIADGGFIYYPNINLTRFISLIFDLNQGMWIGLPSLLWTFLILIPYRFFTFTKKKQFIFKEDVFLIIFIIIIIPVLAQQNWNAGQANFIRYATWGSMPILIWTSLQIGKLKNNLALLCIVPAITLQILVNFHIGGIISNKHTRSISLKPWVEPLWNINPHIYNPHPEIFAERISQREPSSPMPIYIKSHEGAYLKILSTHNTISEVEKEICGDNNVLSPIDSRKTSQPKFTALEHGRSHYLSGRLQCTPAIITSILPSNSSQLTLLTGWSNIEEWGVWSDGNNASFRINLDSQNQGKAIVRIKGISFLNKHHQSGKVILSINGDYVNEYELSYTDFDNMAEISVELDISSLNKAVFTLELPDAISPKTLNISEDNRKLAFGLKEVVVITESGKKNEAN
jgi:hypothetical protein